MRRSKISYKIIELGDKRNRYSGRLYIISDVLDSHTYEENNSRVLRLSHAKGLRPYYTLFKIDGSY
jgi:hypothetical protein